MAAILERVKARFRQSTFLAVGHPITETMLPLQAAGATTKAPQPSPPPITTSDLHFTNGPKTPADLDRITEHNQLHSPFLKLPAELRNRIYHLAVGGYEIYAMPSGLRRFVCMGRPSSQFTWSLRPVSHIMATQLPLICRQIRSEVGKYFVFKYNTFGATTPEYFAMLLESLTLEQRGCIEVVKTNFAGPRDERVVERMFVGLIMLRRLRCVVLRNLGGFEGEEERERVVAAVRRVAKKEELVVEIERVE